MRASKAALILMKNSEDTTVLGDQMGKNAIFHIQKVSFFTKQQSLQSLHGVLTKKLQKIPKIWSKRGQKFNIFGKFILLNRGFS